MRETTPHAFSFGAFRSGMRGAQVRGFMATLERILFIPDVHRPYHDERAWRLMLKAARGFRPHRLVVLGDFGDFYATSSHDKNPNRRRNLEYEVASMNEGLDELDALGAQRRHFLAGNHEDRLERYLMQRAPELFNMVRVPELLRLRARGWTYTPYKQHLRIGRLYATHEVGNAGADAHLRARAAFEGNVVIGHTHRMAVHYSGNAKGTPHVGAMFGWLGDVATIDYAHRVQALRDWQLGFGIGFMDRKGIVRLQACPIVGYEVLVDGRIVRG